MAAKVLLVSLAHGFYERCEIRDFFVAAYCCGNPLVGKIINATQSKCPTTSARNEIVGQCRAMGFEPNDKILMVDHDMVPSMTFFEHAMRVLTDNPGATAIGSPYCGKPPECEVQVVEQDVNGIVRRVSRDEAAVKTGTLPTMLVGTGLFMANVAAFNAVVPPYFDYTYETPAMEKASQTEDFYFCAKLLAAGGKVFCAWDHWSLHDKSCLIGKPSKGEA